MAIDIVSTKHRQQVVLSKEQLSEYDHIIVAFSGGKDCIACLLTLLDAGADRSKIELWHHDIDGRESERFMDWAVTAEYCRAVAHAFNLPIYYSWKQGGFSREMLRDGQRTAPISFETPNDGVQSIGGTRGKLSTRRKFPQVSGDLSVRWCSAYLKVDVCSSAICNQPRFRDNKTLLVSGERAQESRGRAKYAELEPDRSDNRGGAKVDRYVDRYRPVHKWSEADVWEIIERHHVRVHPAYYIGWGRVSCAACIFGSCHQWASLAKIDPDQVSRISAYEREFGFTINRKKSVDALVNEGVPYEMADEDSVTDAMRESYEHEIFVEKWALPAGAFGESCGPT